MLLTEFAYNNAKNANTRYTSFKPNCDYHPCISFEDKVDFHLKSCSVDKLAKELRVLRLICQQNLLHAEKLQKLANDKDIKPRSYVSSKKICLNDKYIQIKCNQKLKTKFFSLF